MTMFNDNAFLERTLHGRFREKGGKSGDVDQGVPRWHNPDLHIGGGWAGTYQDGRNAETNRLK